MRTKISIDGMSDLAGATLGRNIVRNYSMPVAQIMNFYTSECIGISEGQTVRS